MNTRFDDHFERATDSAVGRFLYRFVFPTLIVLVGWLGTRAISSLDETITEVKSSTTETAADVQVIRAQMDYQTKYQALVDRQQNEKLERHDRALNLK